MFGENSEKPHTVRKEEPTESSAHPDERTGMSHPALSATDWFRRYKETFERSWLDPATPLGLYRHQRQVLKFWDWSRAEWTACFGVFLARLASDQGFRQEWEEAAPKGTGRGRPRYDYAWYAPSAREDAEASAIFEHEILGDSILAKDGEVTKLFDMDTPPPLRVVVTYPTDKVGRCVIYDDTEKYLKNNWAKEDKGTEFLLVLGAVRPDSEQFPPRAAWWEGSVWKDGSLSLTSIS